MRAWPGERGGDGGEGGRVSEEEEEEEGGGAVRHVLTRGKYHNNIREEGKHVVLWRPDGRGGLIVL